MLSDCVKKLQVVGLMEAGKDPSGQSSGGTKKGRVMMAAKVFHGQVTLVNHWV